jgi:hypothetical protein
VTGESDFEPAWSPDGTKIAFARGAFRAEELWVVDTVGTNAHRLRKRRTVSPTWSPDGTKLAFLVIGSTARCNGDCSSVWVANANGSNPRQLDDGGFDGPPDWSPDGSRLVFFDGWRFAVIGADGGNRQQLWPGYEALDPRNPRWSPDGTKIAFDAGRLPNRAIWTMDADGSNPVQVTPDSGDSYPAWQPRPMTPSPLSLAFQPRLINTHSAGKTLTLTNNTDASADVSGVALAGADAGSFRLGADTCSAHTLAPGQSCTAEVSFWPVTAGTKRAQALFSDSGPGSPQAIALTGTAKNQGQLALSVQGLTFGHWKVGTTSPAKSVTLTSTGTEPVIMSAIGVEGDFAGDFVGLTQDCTRLGRLDPGQSCTASLAFKPSAIGTHTASLVITDSAPGSPHHVSLSGTGT